MMGSCGSDCQHERTTWPPQSYDPKLRKANNAAKKWESNFGMTTIASSLPEIAAAQGG
jgi:hypothetical protein